MLCELETDKVSGRGARAGRGVLAEIVAARRHHRGRIGQAGGDLRCRSGARTAARRRSTQPAAAAPARMSKMPPRRKKAMAEAGLSRDQVTGTGRDGRIMKDDVSQAPAAAGCAARRAGSRPPAMPRAPVAADDAAREERVKMTRLRQTIAKRLKDSQNTAAMLTTYNEVDMTEVMALRNEYKDLFEKKHGVKLGFMSFFTKACCHALKEVPEVNAEIDGTDIVYKNFVHMGIAAGTPTGLVVPVIRDADQMCFAAIEKAIAEKAPAPATASSAWPKCRAAPSPSPTAASTAR